MKDHKQVAIVNSYNSGIEAIGSNDPAIDAEVIALAVEFYRGMGLKILKLY